MAQRRDRLGRFAGSGSTGSSSGQPKQRPKSALQAWNDKVAQGRGSVPDWAKEAQAKWDAKKAASNAIKKAKPTPLRTASGTVLNSGARLNSPPRKKRK